MREEASPLWPEDNRIGSVDGAMYEMPSGHRYVIAASLHKIRPELVEKNRVKLTRHVLDYPPSSVPVAFTTHNIDEVLGRPLPSMRECAARVLQEIVSTLDARPGRLRWESGPALNYLLRKVTLQSQAEMREVLKYLEGEGYIELGEDFSGSFSVTMPVRGLVLYQDNVDVQASKNAFVAMWFSQEMTEVYEEAIAPAIEENGYVPVRIDREQYNHKIDDEIIASIRRSRFVISDFSCGSEGARGGVYYEAGFAAGLGKPVIFTVREADLMRVHFDTRQFNHIVWNEPIDLREALANRIAATISEQG